MSMVLQSSYICLQDVRFRAFHGVLPQERQVGGDFKVTLRVSYDVGAAMLSDEVADTLDYSQLYKVVAREMAIPSQLLEHVAGRIAQAVANDFPKVCSIDLWLTKVTPPMGADCDGAGVELHITK